MLRFVADTRARRMGVADMYNACSDWLTVKECWSTVKVKGKASSLDIAPLTVLDSGALQPRKWQVTGNDCSTAAQAVAAQSLR